MTSVTVSEVCTILGAGTAKQTIQYQQSMYRGSFFLCHRTKGRINPITQLSQWEGLTASTSRGMNSLKKESIPRT